MPFGGLTSSGSGLQLQASSPGTPDIGNASIDGVLYAEKGAYPIKVNPNDNGQAFQYGNIYIGTGITFNWGAQPDDILSTINIGSSQTISTNPNGNNSFGGINIGYSTNTKDPAGIVIGYGAENGSSANYPTSNAYNVVIGQQAKAYGSYGSSQPGDTVIGAYAQSGFNNVSAGPANPNTIFGANCKATTAGAAGGQNLLVGCHLSTLFKNNLVIKQGSPSSPYTAGQDNLIKIGDPSHTLVELGGMTFNKPTVTGLKADNAALADLITKLAAMGLIIDETK